MAKFIPSPEFSILQEQRIKALEAYAYRVQNTLSHIGTHTKEPDTRDRAYATLDTYPKTPRCTRSHPHELMDEHCKTMAWIEQASAAMRLAEDATRKAASAQKTDCVHDFQRYAINNAKSPLDAPELVYTPVKCVKCGAYPPSDGVKHE